VDREQGIYREEVLLMMGMLADIRTGVDELVSFFEGEDDEAEEDQAEEP
jgi:hypothetical protein